MKWDQIDMSSCSVSHLALVRIFAFSVLLSALFVPVNAMALQSCGWMTTDIRLHSRVLPASTNLLPADVFPADMNERIYVLLQFREPLDLEGFQIVELAGITLLECLDNCVYLASLSNENLNDYFQTTRNNDLRILTDLHDRDVVSRGIQRTLEDEKRKFEGWAVSPDGTKLKVLVGFHRDVEPVDARSTMDQFADIGLVDPEFQRHGPHTWAAKARIDSLDKIAAEKLVRRIEQGPIPFIPLNGTVRPYVKTDIVHSPDFSEAIPVYRASGAAAKVGICDNGIMEGHPDFQKIVDNGAGGITTGADRFYRNYPSITEGRHATRVASVAAGSGYMAHQSGEGPGFYLRGHAPDVSLGDYPQFGSDIELNHQAAVEDGSHVTNHSYVQSYTVYNDEASGIDDIVRGRFFFIPGTFVGTIPSRPQVWAAGNKGYAEDSVVAGGNEQEEGYYSVDTSAKNTISVGSIDTIDGRLSRFSSLGPTFDGRIKPDLVAPGCFDSNTNYLSEVGIKAADFEPGVGPKYGDVCGTSMAAPVVTGIVGLMIDRFLQTFGLIPELRSSTVKALLINTAVDQIKTEPYEDDREYENPDTQSPVIYHAGPDFSTGYGLVDAVAAANAIVKTSSWREGVASVSHPIHMRCVYVPRGSRKLQVTLAWDDEAGCTLEPEDTAKLWNDLDLKLVSPSGAVKNPWKLDPPPLGSDPGDGAIDPISPGDITPAYSGVDRVNNVEMVTTHYPEHGIWRVYVDAGNRLCLGSSQPYSLVSTHRFSNFCPIAPVCIQRPWICRDLRVCRMYPWVCREIKPKKLMIENGIWSADLTIATGINDLCRFFGECPQCQVKGWETCPGWEVTLNNVPEDLVVFVFDGDGEVVSEAGAARESERQRVVRVANTKPGQRYFLGFSDAEGLRREGIIPIAVEVRALDDRP